MQFRTSIVLIALAGKSLALVVNVPESWSGPSLREWACVDQSVSIPQTNGLSIVEGMLQMTPVVNPEHEQDPRWSFVADADSSEGRFIGSHYEAGVFSIELNVSASCAAIMKTGVARWITGFSLVRFC